MNDMKPITELLPTEFLAGDSLKVTHNQGKDEEFIITCIGRIAYAVSLDHGYSYTRPQLIQKYQRADAMYVRTANVRS